MNEYDTDVVIVGGGLAGLTAGGRLARRGYRVTVVEAAATMIARPRGVLRLRD
jgi:2-polyprenyl-6-methoxyphenol hydroxylase-like FAD-dependent oxidoreductase